MKFSANCPAVLNLYFCLDEIVEYVTTLIFCYLCHLLGVFAVMFHNAVLS
jgi:hypothetical protein